MVLRLILVRALQISWKCFRSEINFFAISHFSDILVVFNYALTGIEENNSTTSLTSTLTLPTVNTTGTVITQHSDPL